MKKINEIAGHPDVILVNGDFAAHDIAAKRGKAEPHYDILQSVITQSFNQYIGAIFPKSVFIPTIGNNDVMYYYEFPINEEHHNEYYGFLYNLCWNQVPGNTNYTKKEEIKSSMMKGEYFIYECNTNLTFIAVNSLYFSVKNEKYNTTVSREQLEWVEDVLNNSQNSTKFVINMHIFPDFIYLFLDCNPGEKQQFWLDKFTNKFAEIMRKYSHKIILMNGAHTHISDIRGSWIRNEKATSKHFLKEMKSRLIHYYYANFVSPSVSLYYLINPEFTTLTIENATGKIYNVTTHFLELDKTYNSTNLDMIFHSVNYDQEFGIKECNLTEVYNIMIRAQNNDNLFKKFLTLKLGYRLDQESAAMKVYENLGMIDFKTHNRIYWCFFQHIYYSEHIERMIFYYVSFSMLWKHLTWCTYSTSS